MDQKEKNRILARIKKLEGTIETIDNNIVIFQQQQQQLNNTIMQQVQRKLSVLGGITELTLLLPKNLQNKKYLPPEKPPEPEKEEPKE